MKIKGIKYKEGRTYARTWVNALNVLLGWPEERTLAWAEQYRTDLNDENNLFFHRTPSYYLIKLIVPETLKESLGARERLELRNLLLINIERDGIFCCDRPSFDWRLVKRRIARVLRQVELLKARRSKNIEHVLRSKQHKLEARMRPKISEKYLRKLLRECSGPKIGARSPTPARRK